MQRQAAIQSCIVQKRERRRAYNSGAMGQIDQGTMLSLGDKNVVLARKNISNGIYAFPANPGRLHKHRLSLSQQANGLLRDRTTSVFGRFQPVAAPICEATLPPGPLLLYRSARPWETAARGG